MEVKEIYETEHLLMEAKRREKASICVRVSFAKALEALETMSFADLLKENGESRG